MTSWMCFQNLRSCKRLWTKSTSEWFFPCMNSCMYFQMVRLWKRLCTKSTTEWFLSCMNSGVSSERWWILEGFITHWTPEASLWMTSQMNLENVWCRKRLCTLGTTMKILSCSCYFISEINVCQTICLRLLVQENFFVSALARKITSIHIQEQYIFMQIYQHCSRNPLLSKALVWGTDKILHKLQKWGVTLPNISLKCVQNWFWPNMATTLTT
jgi:hypothetical protein